MSRRTTAPNDECHGRRHVESLNATRDKRENKNNGGENGELYFKRSR
jgi:hypothetical protein